MKFWFEHGAWASRKARQQIASLQPDAVRRIAVIRHAALGDMVLVRPFLRELRRHFPNAELTLSIVSHYTYGAPLELVEHVHIMYGNDRREVPLREQIRRARELGPQDLIFDQANTTRSHWLCLLSQAKLRIGFPYRSWQRHVFYDAAVWRSDLQYEADTLLDMLRLFGFKPRMPMVFDLPGQAAPSSRPYLLYFPTASIIKKCWPVERFTQLIEQLALAYPAYDHLVLQGIAAWETIEPIMQSLDKYTNIIGRKSVSLEDTTSVIKGATLVIANDTGVRNLAIAANTPTLGIFFYSPIPFRYLPRYGLHEAVFEPDGAMPAVAAVYATANALLQRISKS
jgi:ADP-heptose:LPS heptosyltransferase